MRCDMKNK